MHTITSCPLCEDDFMYENGSYLDLYGQKYPVAFDENGNAVSFAPLCYVCHIKAELDAFGAEKFSYQEYKRVVKETWESGGVNELECSGLLIEKDRTDHAVSYRIATEEEFEKMLKNHE